MAHQTRNGESPPTWAQSSSAAIDFFEEIFDVLRELNTFAYAMDSEHDRRTLREVVVEMRRAADALEMSYSRFLALGPWLDTMAEEFSDRRYARVHFVIEPPVFEYGDESESSNSDSDNALVIEGQSIVGLQSRDSVMSILDHVEGKSSAEAEEILVSLEEEWEQSRRVSAWRGSRLMVSFCGSFHQLGDNGRSG